MRRLREVLLGAAGILVILGLTGCGQNYSGKEGESQQVSELNFLETQRKQEESVYLQNLEIDGNTSLKEEKESQRTEEQRETFLAAVFETEEQKSFLATVVEIEEQGIIVEARKEEWERSSCDRIRIGNSAVVSAEGMPELEVGDLVQIVYNGDIMETYPAQLGIVFAVYRQEEADTKTAEYSCQYANIKLQLPKQWEYEKIPAEQENETSSNQNFGICFYPKEEEKMRLKLLYWENGIGMCGTGVTIEHISFQNKMTAVQYTETIDEMIWITLVYQDLPGTYVLNGSVPKELWEKYQPAVMELLESAELGKGNLEKREAVQIAKEALMEGISMPEQIAAELKDSEDPGFYDNIHAVFQYRDGSWKVEFYNSQKSANRYVVWVDRNGAILEEMCGIKGKE